MDRQRLRETIGGSGAVIKSMSALEKYERWFFSPLLELEKMGKGDGAFIALSVSFGLFERFIKSELKRKNIKGNYENFLSEAVSLLEIDKDLFDKFWGMYRDGIQHYLQPKVFTSGGVTYGWQIGASYGELPQFHQISSVEKVIIISPWKWAVKVVELWRARPELLETFNSHSLGKIYNEETEVG